MSDDNARALVEDARALALDTVVRLFSAEDADTDSWQKVVERYRRHVRVSSGKPLYAELDAAGALADVVCSCDLDSAERTAARISDESGSSLYRLVARAVLDDRLASMNPRDPARHAALADSLYALMPEYYQTLDNYLAGSLRIVAVLIDFFACQQNFRGTLAQASSLTAGASHLAAKYGIYQFVDAVVEIGQRVLQENAGASGTEASGLWTVANNLANLQISLAKDHPAGLRNHYNEALTSASLALECLRTASGTDLTLMREASLQQLVQLHMKLAEEERGAGPHSAEARRLANEYAGITSDQEQGSQWREAVEQRLDQVAAQEGREEYEAHAARFALDCSLSAARFIDAAKNDAERVVSAGSLPERTSAAVSILDKWYSELADELDRALPKSGFDFAVCKLVLALGAIASGRLGEMTERIVYSWLTTAGTSHDAKNWAPIRARQYLPADDESSADHASAAGRVAGIATLTQMVWREAPDIPFTDLLRDRNASLLARMIAIRPLFQECSGPALSREQDVQTLSALWRNEIRVR